MLSENSVSVTIYNDSPVFLFPSIPASSAGFENQALKSAFSFTAKKTVTYSAMVAAIKLADSQAVQRDGALRKLVIIASPIKGKTQQISKPENFDGGIIYVSPTSDSIEVLQDLAGIENTCLIDTSALADSLFACVTKINPSGKKAQIIGDDSFSIGSWFKNVRKASILLETVSGEIINVQHDGVAVPEENIFQYANYGVINLSNTSSGKFSVSNGQVLLVIQQEEISPWLFIIFGIVGLVILIVIIIIVCSAVRHSRNLRKPVYEITCEYNDDTMMGNVYLCIKKDPKESKQVQKGASILEICKKLKIPEATYDSSIVSSAIIETDKNGDWIIRRKEQENPDEEAKEVIDKMKNNFKTDVFFDDAYTLVFKKLK
jgi:hypothetical protein